MPTLLIIGAGGFIGRHIAAQALAEGYDTYIGVRESTSLRHLSDPRLKKVVFDYDDPQQVQDTLRDNGPWDYIIYNLGATKVTNYRDFNRINYGYLTTIGEALIRLEMIPRRLVYMSSLSAVGAGDEVNYTPLTTDMTPQPNTRYGLSKIKAEQWLQFHPSIPWIILRPTGVYGPGEKDYAMMVQCIRRGWDFGVGYRQQRLTFVYVTDLVQAMFAALKAPEKAVHNIYIISETQYYTQGQFRQIVKEVVGRRFVIPIRLPLWAMKGVCSISELWGKIRLKPSTLNTDKYRILRQRNWTCDTAPATRDLGFTATTSLRQGLESL